MKTNWELKENSQGELVVEVPLKTWQDAQKKAFNKLAKEVKVDGFRQGSVPEHIAKKHINSGAVLMDAVDIVASDALMAGVDAHALELIARPELAVEKMSEDELVLKFNVTVKPVVTLGTYKGLTAEKEVVVIKDDEVSSELVKLQEQLAQLEIKEAGTLAVSETAVIDFEGFLEGVPFEGGKGENFSLVIGSNQFIPGFEEQLVGMNVGEEKDITVTFPTEYPAEQLAGKETVFKVKLHEIKVKVLPVLDDEFAKEANIETVETLADLKQHLLTRLTTEKEKEVENKYLDSIYGMVVEGATVEIPQVLINQEVENIFKDFEQRLSQQGLTIEGYQEFTNKTVEEIKAEMATEALNRVKFRLVIEAIAVEEAVEVAEAEIEAEIEAIATAYQMEVDYVKQMFGDLSGISGELKARKALKIIEENSK